ncbi:MAG TPA: hypothetical protein VFB36_02865 [Nevskiaceae bacterium]|nr:hypothetical protein [Nevskiaceae bacterium]
MIDDRRLWTSAFGLILLLMATRLFLGDYTAFAGAQDLKFFDESQYLAAGIYSHGLHGLSPQWAPPYCLWDRLLFRSSGDAIAAYHLNAYVLAIALPALWYLLCVAIGIAPWWALATALAWLVSNTNLETLRVGNFAACTVLGGVLLSRLVQRAAIAWWVAAAALWVAASVRLELLPAGVVVVIAGAWLLQRGWQSWPKTAAWLVAAVLPQVAIDLAFGSPFGGGRSGAAFQQHLAGNILAWHDLPFENWIHYEDVIRRYYALPSGALDFAVHEPSAFLHHVASNLWRLVSQSIPHALAPATSLALLTPIAIAISGGIALKLRTARAPYATTPVSIALTACGSMVLISCAVIYPREHYLPLLICALLLLVAPKTDAGRGPSSLIMLVLATIVASAPSYPSSKANVARTEQETVEALRRLDASKLNLFDDSGVLQVYVPAQRFGPRDFRAPFDQFVRSHEINAIVLSPTLGKDPLLRADDAWQRFEASPEAAGFRCQPIGNTDRRLCLHN